MELEHRTPRVIIMLLEMPTSFFYFVGGDDIVLWLFKTSSNGPVPVILLLYAANILHTH